MRKKIRILLVSLCLIFSPFSTASADTPTSIQDITAAVGSTIIQVIINLGPAEVTFDGCQLPVTGLNGEDEIAIGNLLHFEEGSIEKKLFTRRDMCVIADVIVVDKLITIRMEGSTVIIVLAQEAISSGLAAKLLRENDENLNNVKVPREKEFDI